MCIQLCVSYIQISSDYYWFCWIFQTNSRYILTKSCIKLFSVIASLQLFAYGWDIDINQDKRLKLQSEDSSFLAMFSLLHILCSTFWRIFWKYSDSRVTWRVFGKIPITVISRYGDVGRGIKVFFVGFCLSDTDDIWFIIVNIGIKHLFGDDWSDSIDIPVTNNELWRSCSFTVSPAMCACFYL